MKTIIFSALLIMSVSIFLCMIISAIIISVKKSHIKKSENYMKFRNIRKYNIVMLIMGLINIFINYSYINDYHHTNDFNFGYTKYLYYLLLTATWLIFFLSFAVVLIFSGVMITEKSFIIDMSEFSSKEVKYKICENNEGEFIEFYTCGKKPNFIINISLLDNQKYEKIFNMVKNNYKEYDEKPSGHYQFKYIISFLCIFTILSIVSVIYYKVEMPFIFVGDKVVETNSHEAIFGYGGLDDFGWSYSIQPTHNLTSDDLKNLKYMPNLQRLNLTGNSIDDLTEIGQLINLKQLYIGGGEIYAEPSDYSPLENLINLDTLVLLGAEKFDNFSCLKSMHELKTFKITGCNISSENLSILSEIENLENLCLDMCVFEDTSQLLNYKSLKTLCLNNVETNNFAFLKNLDAVETLEIVHTEFDDYSVLTEIKNLKQLYVDENQLPEEIISQLKNSNVEIHECY